MTGTPPPGGEASLLRSSLPPSPGVPSRGGGGGAVSAGATRDYLGLSASSAPVLVKRGDFSPLSEWFLVADPDIPSGLAWHCWRALSAALDGQWGRRLLQYVPSLPAYAGYAEHAGDISPYLAPARALLYLTSQQPADFGVAWCAWHSWEGDSSPYAFQPTAKNASCGGWMPDFDWLTIPLSHELGEMITDPLPGTATGWDAPDGEENADLCNWRRYAVMAPAAGEWPAREYGVSQFWCNDLGTCGP